MNSVSAKSQVCKWNLIFFSNFPFVYGTVGNIRKLKIVASCTLWIIEVIVLVSLIGQCGSIQVHGFCSFVKNRDYLKIQ